jgi:predicted acylesterase/phospholipase RssA
MARGLVLEGGGAKGAYALGCLLAFRDHGISFDVVSGTSVGALNAALVSADRLEAGRRLWQTLSFDKVCRPSRRVSMWALLPIHILAMFLHHVPFFASLPFANRQAPKIGYAHIVITIGVPLAFIWLVYVMFVWFINGAAGLLVEIVLITALMLLLGSVWAVPYWLRSTNKSFLTVDPLRREIQEVLQGATFNMPTYVTLTREQEMFDPDEPGFYHIASQFGYIRGAMSQQEHVPKYIRLDRLPISHVPDVLTASAAIPFGIFPAVVLENETYIDGGLADNMPLLPVLQFHNCDEIYVVRLRPDRDGVLIQNWESVDRRLRVACMDQGTCKTLYRNAMTTRKARSTVDEIIHPPENVPYRRLPLMASRIVVVSPRKSLGSFLSGTMNFSGRYARRLLDCGYRDAYEVVQSRKQEHA